MKIVLKPRTSVIAFLLSIGLLTPVAQSQEGDEEVLITRGQKSVSVTHDGQAVEIQRVQDKDNEIIEFYRKTTRGRIQPMHPFAPNKVETIGEREVIDYIKKQSDGDESILIIDSRTEFWVKRTGLIPGAVNIPYTEFDEASDVASILELEFNVTIDETFNFSAAKTLVMYCNGIWCGQSPAAITTLLAMGYPAAKIKYYRGGLQNWASLGLTVIPQKGD